MTRTMLVAATVLLSAAATADPVAWRVADDDGDLWLLGSVHYLRDSDYPLPDVIGRLYSHADRLVMELDLDDIDPVEMQGALLEAAMLPEGESLAALLGAGLHARAADRAETFGLDLVVFDRVRPWLVALTLMDLGMRSAGYRAERGLEQHLLARAAADGKPISGLETVAAQIAVFEALSLAEQRAVLEQTLDELEGAGAATAELIEAWRDGRFDVLGTELLREFDAYPRLYDALVAERNRRWIASLIELLETPGTELAVVGALHLVGPDSVIRLLRDRGYTVERIDDGRQIP